MRPFIAALLGAAASLPALVHATTPPVFPEPADATAPVPPLSAPSWFTDYVPYREPTASSWPALNRAVATSAGMGGMHHDVMRSASADDGQATHGTHEVHSAHGSTHEEPGK